METKKSSQFFNSNRIGFWWPLNNQPKKEKNKMAELSLPPAMLKRIAKREQESDERKRKAALPKVSRKKPMTSQEVDDLHRYDLWQGTGVGSYTFLESRWKDNPRIMRRADVERAFYGERSDFSPEY